MSHQQRDIMQLPARSFLGSFWRAQTTSIVASLMHTTVFSFFSLILGVYYVTSNAIGAIAGAILSFYLGRNWAFKKKNGKLRNQAFRYLITSGISLALNTYGIYFVTETFHIFPLISQIIVAILVGVFFNFLMFRYFVYK